MDRPEQAHPPLVVSSLDKARLERMIELREGELPPVLEGLAAELDRAEVVAPEAMPDDVVTMNSTVRFIVEPAGQTFTRTLVYPHDVGGEGRVSVAAPAGAALLGLRAGQAIDWPMPGHPGARVRVLEVVDQPERNGDYAR